MMNSTRFIIRLSVTFFCLVLIIASSRAMSQKSVPLWPKDELPNSKGITVQDSLHNDRMYMNKYPEMFAFHPAKEENSGVAVLIFPGGGYNHLTYDLGGFQLAKWFNTIGVHAFVVNYRLPKSPDLIQREIAPLQDAQRAMRLVRSQAGEFQINQSKIGVMGTSAGGHLASTIGTHSEDHSAIGDSLDSISFAPDFMVMVSPVITFGEYAHEGSKNNLLGDNASQELIETFSNELKVDKHTPPAFIVHAANDQSVHPRNSLIFFDALIEHGVTSSSLHIFPQGEHAIGVAGNPGSTHLWLGLCEEWLNELEMIDDN